MDRAHPLADERASARAAWRAAADFEALCALGAAFLEGRCAHFPGWGAPATDPETDAIRERLVALHARGFLSVASQPALGDPRAGDALLQRAFVAGFARVELARALARSPRIAVRAWTAGGPAIASATARSAADEEPVTTVGGVARVVAGGAARDDELALFAGEIGDAALRELAALAYVVAWDPEFGRRDLLWDELLERAPRR